MVAFLAYFIGDYLKAAPSQFGWIVLAVATSLLASHLVSTMLLPDDPERDFRRAMSTIDHRINLILRHLLRRADGSGAPKDKDRRLRAHLSSLRDIMLTAEGFIPQGRTGALAAKGAASDLATALFDLQLVVERLVRARHTSLPDPSMVRALLDERGSLLRHAPEVEASGAERPDIAVQLLLRLRDARVRINAALGFSPSPAFETAGEKDAEEGKDAKPSDNDEDETSTRPRIPEPLHRPIQVTLACALALVAGMQLSPTGWYWAVITAFIVFNNTRSRDDTAMRALQRSAGTLGGLFVGTAVATILQGHMVTSGVAIPVLFFLAFYFLQTSYGLMIFFVTIALALLYGLMGMFTPQLLVVRLEETVVGGIAGTLVAFLVFPVSTTRGVETAVSDFMDALEKLISAADRRVHMRKGAGDLTALSRDLDRRYSDLAAAVRPLSAPWSVVTRFGHVRLKLLPLMGSVHWSRVLAQTLDTEAPLPDAGDQKFDALTNEIRDEIRGARAAGADLFLRLGSRQGDAEMAPPAAMRAASGNEKAVDALEAIRDLLKRLNARAGAKGLAGS